MDFKVLKQNILNKTLPDNLMLAGDPILIQIYLDKISSLFNIRVLNNLYDYLSLKNSKLKEDTNIIYIIKEDEVFKNNSSLWGLKYNDLVLCYPNLKKEKFYKAFENNIVYFNKLTDDDLIGGIKFKVDLDDNQINLLIQSNNHDYYRIMNDVDKLAIFDKANHKKLFNIFKQDKIICIQDIIEDFAFSNSILDRDKIKALQILDKTSKQDILSCLTLAYNNLRNQLLVQNHLSNNKNLEERAKELNLNKGLYYILNKKINTYSTQELCFMLLALGNYLNNIKLGLIDSLDAVYLFVMRYL